MNKSSKSIFDFQDALEESIRQEQLQRKLMQEMAWKFYKKYVEPLVKKLTEGPIRKPEPDPFSEYYQFFINDFAVDLVDTEQAYLLTADLPGLTKKAINISYTDDVLVISTKRTENTTSKERIFVLNEIGKGKLERKFTLKNIDKKKIEAHFNNGILQVILPKAQVSPKDVIRIK